MRYFIYKYKKNIDIFLCFKEKYYLNFFTFKNLNNIFKSNLYYSYFNNTNCYRNIFFGFSKKKLNNISYDKKIFNKFIFLSNFNYEYDKKINCNYVSLDYFFYINNFNNICILIKNFKNNNIKKIIIILKKIIKVIKISGKKILYNFFYKNSEEFSIKKNIYKKIFLFIKKKINIGKIMQLQIGKEKIYKTNLNAKQMFYYLSKVNYNTNKIFFNNIKNILICFSPETLVERNNKVLKMFPIAGTIIRGNNIIKDTFYEYKMKKDKKEISEHLMLIDLTRNDINKVNNCYNTFVTKKFVTKKIKNLQHIVSEIKTYLKKKSKNEEIFSSITPAGTLSGNPKKKSIKYIKKIESKRNFYGGSLGIISSEKLIKIIIIIRSLFIKKKYSFLRSASGIVLNSEIKNEWKELNNKLKLFLYKK
ncbi:chorismate-binding protein [Candidatus Vidania fulgoroideorum]